MAVTLGLPGAWAADSDPVDVFASRVGGDLVVPAAAEDAFASQALLCKVCTSPLQLVLQVHAPCDEDQVGHSVHDRILFLLGCTAARCGTAAGSWRAFRLQPASQPAPTGGEEVYSVQPTPVQEEAAPPTAAQPPHSDAAPGAASSSGAFGFGAASFGFGGHSAPADGAGGDPMSFADLDSALSTISSAGSTSPAATAPRKPPAGGGTATAAEADQHAGASGAAADAVRLPRGASPLPEFHIRWREEPGGAHDAMRPADAAHIASLVDQYEAEHEMADPAGEGWTGEAYEADVLPGGNSSFPKFSRRLQRAPGQCVRYSFGGPILWPRPQPPQPPPCDACGAARTLEVQAMPALHTALDEGLQWRSDSAINSRDGSGSDLSIDAWSWLTIAVFTCSNSCSVGTGYTVVEEHVELADE